MNSSLLFPPLLDADKLSSAGGEISFRLPLASVSQFAGLFAELEDLRVALGLGGYGMAMTTLEEVFLKIAKQGEAELYNAEPTQQSTSLLARFSRNFLRLR